MKKTTKGALAAGGAAVLLLGGAGTLAYWTEDTAVGGGSLSSGHLEITGNTCGTADWLLDDGTTVATAAKIVPGDTITKTCAFTIDGVGDHFDNVSISIDAPSWNASGDAELTSALGTVSATYADSGGPVVSGDTVNVGETITATLSMTFDSATTGDIAEDQTAILDDIAITVTQNHTP